MQCHNKRNSQLFRNRKHGTGVYCKVRMYDLGIQRCNRTRKSASVSSSQKGSAPYLFIPEFRSRQRERRVMTQVQAIHPLQSREHRPKSAKRVRLRKNKRLGGRQEFVAINQYFARLHLKASRWHPGDALLEPQERTLPKAIRQHGQKYRRAKSKNLVECQGYYQMLRQQGRE